MSHPASRKRSRISHFQTPFIVSIAAPAALGIACGGQTDLDPHDAVAQAGGSGSPYKPPIYNPPAPVRCQGPPPSDPEVCGRSWACANGVWTQITVSCNPPPSVYDCPPEPAEVGSSCNGFGVGLTCEYAYCYDATAPMRVCDSSTQLWRALPVPSCNPPPPSSICNGAMPVAGSDCFVENEECRYPGCQGPESSSAVCRHGQWVVAYSAGPACNPPPVVPVCPEREIVTGTPCWYGGQECEGPSACTGSSVHGGHICTDFIWQEALFPCAAQDAGSPDPVAADAGP